MYEEQIELSIWTMMGLEHLIQLKIRNILKGSAKLQLMVSVDETETLENVT